MQMGVCNGLAVFGTVTLVVIAGWMIVRMFTHDEDFAPFAHLTGRHTYQEQMTVGQRLKEITFWQLCAVFIVDFAITGVLWVIGK